MSFKEAKKKVTKMLTLFDIYSMLPGPSITIIPLSKGQLNFKVGNVHDRVLHFFSRIFMESKVSEPILNVLNQLNTKPDRRKSVVRLTDRPDMTLDVYRGRKTTIQPKPDRKMIIKC